jgi:hypothetical protein
MTARFARRSILSWLGAIWVVAAGCTVTEGPLPRTLNVLPPPPAGGEKAEGTAPTVLPQGSSGTCDEGYSPVLAGTKIGADPAHAAPQPDTTTVSALARLTSHRAADRDGSVESAGFAEAAAGRLAADVRPAAAPGSDNPHDPITAAVSALRRDRPQLAIELLERPGTEAVPSAQRYRILGVAYYRLGDFESSQVALRQALSLDNSSALSYLLMGCTLLRLGQFESAEAHLRLARTLDPGCTVER